MSKKTPAKVQHLDRPDDVGRYAGPAVDITSEYPAIDSPELQADCARVAGLISQLQKSSAELKGSMGFCLLGSLSEEEISQLVTKLQAAAVIMEEIRKHLFNLSTYVNLFRQIDKKDPRAQKVYSFIVQNQSDFEVAGKPIWLFLDRAPASLVEKYLDHPLTQAERFSVAQSRALSDTLLSENEETMITRFKTHGPVAWGDLYDELSSGMRCRIEIAGKAEEVGLAQAMGFLRDSHEGTRKSAWEAIQKAWQENERSCAFILNGLAGWRLEEMRIRSHSRKLDFLDLPLHLARIKSETLQAMFSAIRENIAIPHRAMRALASGLGKPQLDPWDLLAAAPAETGGRRTHDEGLALIREAFASVDGELGQFVDLMKEKRWIEGRVLPSKGQGAFTTRFAKSGTPRIYQTYMGSASDIRTLAHEMGHAYHNWIMRDLPSHLHRNPMTLAESASIFAETALADHLVTSSGPATAYAVAWQNAESATAYLLNMPARYDFEKNFYERRKSGFVPASELGDLTENAWRSWYEGTLSFPERRFWQTKLHFSLPWISFYNYPYTFGYLFSLRIFSRRQADGPSFMPKYRALLRDTGRMTAEELAKTHLGEDITKPAFWKASLDIVDRQVAHFEGLLTKRKAS